jgi:hypothetical protein
MKPLLYPLTYGAPVTRPPRERDSWNFRPIGNELVTGFLRRIELPESGTALPHEWPASSEGARVWSVQAE